MKIIFWTFLLLISAASASESLGRETKDFESNGIKSLEISNPKGEILVSFVKNSKKIRVIVEKMQFDPKCKLLIESELGIVKVRVEHENALFDKANCVSKMKIEVPNKLINIDVSSGTANVKLIDIDSKIVFKTATGLVEINGELLKNVEGKTATGNMRISYNNCPNRADIDLVTATGDAEILLPSHCKIKVTHKSATGDLFNELGETEDFQVLINSKSAAGSLKIRKLAK
jgi:hypothetical protein